MTDLTQRWRERDESWRPANEPINTLSHEIADIPDDATARAFVERHHYSGTFVAARRRFGLYHHGQLVGVAVFSQPMQAKSVTKYFPDSDSAVELGRLVLLDEVRGNGESFFVAECFRRLKREGFVGVLSFSDPTPRARLDGTVVHPGHVGIVYQSLSAHVEGRSTPRVIRLLPDGRAVNERSVQKIRAGERGGGSGSRLVADLVAAGAAPFDLADPATWVRQALAQVTRPLRHPGNIRYLWGFTPALRRAFPPNASEYPAPAGGRRAPRWGRRVAA